MKETQNNQASVFFNFINSRRGIIFNLLFLFYIGIVQPLFLESVLGIIYDDQKNITLGIIILVAIVVETIGIYYKSAALSQRVVDTERFSGGFFMIWIMHTVVTVIMYMWALSSFGIDVTADQPHPAMYVIFLVVIKELVVMGFIFLIEDRKKDISFKKEWMADLFLLFFACIAYTATWESISAGPNSSLSQYSYGEAAVQSFAAALLFIIFFIPIRMMHVIEDWYSIRSVREMIEWTVSMLLVTITAVAALF